MPSIHNIVQVKKENIPLMDTMYYAFFTSGMMSTLIGAILPFMKTEYNMSYVLSGAVISAHQVGNFFALFIAGVLPYLIGRKRTTLTLSLGIVIGFLLMTLTANPILLVLAFIFTGVGRGSLSNITNVVISEISGNKTAALNFLHASFSVGAFLAPFLAILCTTVFGIHWRISAWILVVFEIIALFAIGRSSLSNKPMHRKNDEGNDFVKSGRFWLNTFILFFYLCTEASVIGWLVTYFKDSGIFNTVMAQTTSSALWLCILTGRLLCAFLSSKMDKNILLVILGVFQVVFFLMMISVHSAWLIYLSIFGFGLAMSGTYPTTLSTMDKRFNSSTLATGTCIAVATLGAIAMPVLVGIVAQKSGIAGGIATISISIFCMLALIILKWIFSRGKNKLLQNA
ncbi:MFS transporter [uncultured Sphaerochaeta sp.]|uniref:MFS transporter n=1 Tax=uncultured Sphaerochaeta sp. TaxID=886478 RepID=UPI002A0A4B91|nr:MFS transporter [uncultured Sphaerochaeta sp.]